MHCSMMLISKATYLAAPFPTLLDLLQASDGRHHFIFGEKSVVLCVEYLDNDTDSADHGCSDAAKRHQVEAVTNERSSITTIPNAGHLVRSDRSISFY